MKRLWGRETRRGERNLIGKVVSSGDGWSMCGESRSGWKSISTQMERKREDGRDQRGHSCPVVCLAC